MGLTTQQIGKCGELFVQYKLLTFGVESAPMTTDYGIDLVALLPKTTEIAKIQVKATRAKREGTARWVEWPLPKQSEAQYFALVDIERNKGWLLHSQQIREFSRSMKENWLLWWYIISHTPGKKGSRSESEVSNYEIEKVIPLIFALDHAT